ncbi:MAG: AmmeMemoRadiSam system radical SAM enzyme [Syntrophobacteraceae bacterium]
MKEAMFYRKLEGDKVQCFLCAQHCRINPGKRGICGVRENLAGSLWSLVYGKVISQHVDPIEKKPLFHFYPGTTSFSIATAGCNFRCLFCQNADISQAPREYQSISGQNIAAEEVVEGAVRAGCASISYTYTEPTIFMEYALDVAKLAHEANIRNIFVSNGYMTEDALKAVSPYLDAANVDLKAFSDDFYSEQCGAHLKPVLKTLEGMKKLGIWIEVTTLLIPGLNDDPGELRELAQFIVSLGPETPWHVSRFYPTYRLLDRPPTPVETLRKARQIGLEAGLQYVYTGNIPGDEGENTWCHKCGALLFERYGFSTKSKGLSNGVCAQCGTAPAGVGIQ